MGDASALLAGRATPFLLVDEELVLANVDHMAGFARSRGLDVRPHAKTHKCAEVAQRQLAAGSVGLTVATLSEAERLADCGFGSFFLAYPLWVDAAKGARLRELQQRADVLVGIDSVEGARALAAQARGTTVLVEIDSGHHRTGVAADTAGALGEAAARAGLSVAGVFTFPGHSYAPGVQADVAASEAAALSEAVDSFTRSGLDAAVVSGGSTPSVHDADSAVLTEVRPGVYVFGDAQQWELGTTTADRIALTCVATVVSRSEDKVVLDSGSKALGPDRSPWATGNGRLLDHPDARITALSEHHAVVSWPSSSPPPELGSRVRVVPNHVCTAVNMTEVLVTTEGEEWRVVARGCNT
jgi:D-serine deaminase-like pyridoxal phosphate-dependent protein